MALPAQIERRTGAVAKAGRLTRLLDTDQFMALAALALLALLTEGVLVVLLRRLSLKRYPHVLLSNEPVAMALGITERGLTWFVMALGVLALGYILAYAVALRVRDPRWGLAALAAAAIFVVTVIPVFPGGAHDVYHNVVDARTLWLYHQDPISTPPNAHPNDPLVQQLAFWQDLTSSYGPVWYIVSGAPLPFTGASLVRNVVGQKLLVSAFLLGTLALVYLIVRDRRPRSATAAVVLLGWSPLVLWEIPGNAHNDIVMMFFAVAAIYAVHRGAWHWSFPLLALGVGVKFIMILLGPLLLIWLLFLRPRVSRRDIAISIAYAAALLALIYLPFIAASHSFANTDALKSRFISSPVSLTIAFAMQYVALDKAENYARSLALVLFGFGYLAVLWRSCGGFANLTTMAFWAILLTLTIPTWWFWPWYVIWLLPFAALTAGRKHATIGLVFGTSALLVYPIYYWRDVILNGPNWFANQFVIVGAVYGPLALYLLGSSGLHLLTVNMDEGDGVDQATAT